MKFYKLWVLFNMDNLTEVRVFNDSAVALAAFSSYVDAKVRPASVELKECEFTGGELKDVKTIRNYTNPVYF